MMQIPRQRGAEARLALASLFLRFLLLGNIGVTSGAREWRHVLVLERSRAVSAVPAVRGEAGFHR